MFKYKVLFFFNWIKKNLYKKYFWNKKNILIFLELSDTFDKNVGYSALVDQDYELIGKSEEKPPIFYDGAVALDLVIGFGKI